MSETKEKFYNLFWQNKACQNLFLLSKEELLDTKSFEIEGNYVSTSFPRIIISNVNKDDYALEQIKFRTENSTISASSFLKSKVQFYSPIVTNYLENKFGKSLAKLSEEFSTKPFALIKLVTKVITANEDRKEGLLISALQKYGFIGKHINTFKEIDDYFSKEGINKGIKTFLTEENFWNFLEFVKSLKDIYINEVYKSFYSTNQILVNSLHDVDNYEDRLRLFNNLYEAGIISSSNEDAFIECTHCLPGTYRGVIQLKISPIKLKGLKCPVCNNIVTYYIPYELDKEIFEIVKSKDGLLLDALGDRLHCNAIKYVINKHLLDDIELDCFYTFGNSVHIVECKMYKINTSPEKLKSKIREDFGKLVIKTDRIKNEALFKNKILSPILLVNVTNDQLIRDMEVELRSLNKAEIYQRTRIVTVNNIPVSN
jgi:hypothetical protein